MASTYLCTKEATPAVDLHLVTLGLEDHLDVDEVTWFSYTSHKNLSRLSKLSHKILVYALLGKDD